MAIKEEDFESLAIGTQPPFNSWTSAHPTGANIIAGGTKTGLGTSTRALKLTGGEIIYDTYPTFYNSISLFLSILPNQQQFLQGAAVSICEVSNGPDSFGTTRALVNIKIEVDTTLSAYGNGIFICNSGDNVVKLNSHNFLQINIEFSGVTTVIATIHIGLNGVQVASGTADTGILISLLRDYPTQTIAQVNQFEFVSNDLIIDNITIDTLQSIITYPHAGSPQAIVTQGTAEIPIEPDDEIVKVFQGVSEVELLPDNEKLRIYQGVVELILLDQIQAGLWKVREI